MSQKQSEAPYHKGPAQRRFKVAAAPSLTDRSVSPQVDHRQRQIARLSTIAQVLAAYGPEAPVALASVGPDICPATCPYCYRVAVAS